MDLIMENEDFTMKNKGIWPGRTSIDFTIKNDDLIANMGVQWTINKKQSDGGIEKQPLDRRISLIFMRYDHGIGKQIGALSNPPGGQ